MDGGPSERKLVDSNFVGEAKRNQKFIMTAALPLQTIETVGSRKTDTSSCKTQGSERPAGASDAWKTSRTVPGIRKFSISFPLERSIDFCLTLFPRESVPLTGS
ncbi:hypothetical protein CDAR_13261 [Caerostris darwini]|uniref:Uncharacterized protein n=1 Tax=Caerostris darwini TaxID=1538125 RepID=A0AAV4R0T5_9ARAC|nr:hypothetical protein CDAR_13261 [Caerostris darwini]